MAAPDTLCSDSLAVAPNHRLQATVGGGLAVDWRPRSPTAPEPER
jgi:hypothetical protein